MDDSNKAKLGITECQAHRLVNGYPMLETKEDEFVAHYMFTALMMPSGPTRITKDFYDASLVKADHEIKDEEINTLLKSAVKKSNKKKNKKVNIILVIIIIIINNNNNIYISLFFIFAEEGRCRSQTINRINKIK